MTTVSTQDFLSRHQQVGVGRQLTVEERRRMVDPDNPSSPFSRIIGNRNAVEILGLIAFEALGNKYRRCGGQNLAFTGPPGVGKTTFMGLLAKVLKLPVVKINANCLVKATEIFDSFCAALADTPYRLVPYRDPDWQNPDPRGRYFTAPPCIAVIDEVHQLKPTGKVSQALLRATESPHLLETEEGLTLETRDVMFLAATTHWGKVFPALRSRFQQIVLDPYTREEVARILALKYPGMPERVCERVAFMTWRSTREAIRFARLMIQDMKMYDDCDEMAIDRTARRLRIDDFGMKEVRLRILTALGQSPLSLSAIQDVANCDLDELEEEILPPMKVSGPNVKPLIRVCSRGHFITEAGLAELKIRKIPHRGEEVLAKST